MIGKPIKTNKVIAKKDVIEYAQVLVEVEVYRVFPNEVQFVNEKGLRTSQHIVYECKAIICGECKGISHTSEECRKKKYEIALAKVKPRQVWVAKGVKEAAKHPTPNTDQLEKQDDAPLNLNK